MCSKNSLEVWWECHQNYGTQGKVEFYGPSLAATVQILPFRADILLTFRRSNNVSSLHDLVRLLGCSQLTLAAIVCFYTHHTEISGDNFWIDMHRVTHGTQWELLITELTLIAIDHWFHVLVWCETISSYAAKVIALCKVICGYSIWLFNSFRLEAIKYLIFPSPFGDPPKKSKKPTQLTVWEPNCTKNCTKNSAANFFTSKVHFAVFFKKQWHSR